MKRRMLLAGLMTILPTLAVPAQEKTRLLTDRGLELTGFQDPRPYTPAYDLRNDFVMVYGIHESRIPAIQSWVDQGYVPHLMTGIAWGDYQDFKDMNGRDIMSLAQMEADGKEKLHHPGVPYVVPSIEFADYLTRKLKPMIDAGVRAIHLEEPEFWAYTGFSPAFAREWQLYYHEPYVRADSSPDAQYKAAERTFEGAFLEYGVMQELVRGTNRRMWFLADPGGLCHDAVHGIQPVARHESAGYQWHEQSHTVQFQLPPGVTRQRITILW